MRSRFFVILYVQPVFPDQHCEQRKRRQSEQASHNFEPAVPWGVPNRIDLDLIHGQGLDRCSAEPAFRRMNPDGPRAEPTKRRQRERYGRDDE